MNIESSKDFVPLYQTIAWMIFVLVLIVVLWRKIGLLFRVLLRRLEQGAKLEFWHLTLGEPPANLQSGNVGAATTEGEAGRKVSHDIETLLSSKQYPNGVVDNVFLIHASEVLTPRTKPNSGRYRVRVWVEAYKENLLDDIESVAYRLYDDFPQNIIVTSARDKSFELWLNVYGEFTIVSYIKRKNDASPLWLSRFLDLPGRPPD